MAKKRVYFFGNGKAEANATMKMVIGGKGANLAEMTNLGIPVPAGFSITTQTCADCNHLKGKWPVGLDAEVIKNVKKLEKALSPIQLDLSGIFQKNSWKLFMLP